jgi:hypothetical protein
MLFRINTPGPGFDLNFPSMQHAVEWAERYLPCGPRSTRHVRAVHLADGRVGTNTRVLGPTGKVKTGAIVYPLLPGDAGYGRALARLVDQGADRAWDEVEQVAAAFDTDESLP